MIGSLLFVAGPADADSLLFCRDVTFAHGGHLFAAVNGISVGIYNSYTAENIGNLRGHNGKVRLRVQGLRPTRFQGLGFGR